MRFLLLFERSGAANSLLRSNLQTNLYLENQLLNNYLGRLIIVGKDESGANSDRLSLNFRLRPLFHF
jgi:hypothetical protein